MSDVMSIQNTFDEFAEQYKIVDEQEIYTNGTELIPIFRMKQWLEHTSNIENKVRKAKTNFDRIKAMSVEEMVDYIVYNLNPCLYCVYREKDHSNGYDCYDGVRKYLESEVQEDET